jgi:hypothetical protein
MLNFKVPRILSSTWIASIYIEPGMVFIAHAVELLLNFCVPACRQTRHVFQSSGSHYHGRLLTAS